MEDDYYKILGVDRDADAEEIKRAYRRVAKECHPDVTHGDVEATERFRRATEAYEVLRDPQRRAAYDRKLRSQSAPASANRWGVLDLADELIWNMLREMRGFPAWEDFDAELEIELAPAEAQWGTRVSFDVPITHECGLCEGYGLSRSGAICPRCGGSGRVEASRRLVIAIPPGVRHGDRLRIPVPTGMRIIYLTALIRILS
ncbi:MAG: DnaJ domain-containing protein [candidate division KSB1 bacterium]|nr:DnaJ domain-containing protein [candidate division KSB1 bacterium]